MLKIRLSRFGKKKRPTYRLIVSEHTKDTQDRALEYLGYYDPHTKVCEVKKDRILYWISKGAQPSPTLHNLFIDQNVIKAEKVKASKSKKKKEEKEKPAEPVAKLDKEKKEKKPPKSEKVKEKKPAEPAKEEEPAEPVKEEKKEESKETTKEKQKTEEKPTQEAK